ncbi:response regulator transcription factor [Hyphomicrobium sp. NDB2Meth4]|uniref:winged helix-turn-helix domain-containing protein n=1 Tax=Hyphomicrobium sp. NDB2Meth4 TaxID=1892846 RepID=UPI0009315526|nr:response regulator transcription factor [Hyphomicrobium sp. NDB2Meth4]
MRILVVEDDNDTSNYISQGFCEEGHVVETLTDGRDGLTQAMGEAYDVLVVDRMLPGLDGLSLVRALRAVGNKVPVIFLTSLGGVDDRVDGLNVGGDDYLVKPFAFSELLARVNALARRPHLKDTDTVLRVGDLEMDLIARSVTRAGDTIELQPREFRLLEVLMRNKGRVLTRTMLLERVWSFHFEPRTSVVETHISRLRTKIDRPYGSELIHTVRGSGYTMHDQP